MYTEQEMLEFAVWCGTNFVSYHSKRDGERIWFDPEKVVYQTTKQLLKIWSNK